MEKYDLLIVGNGFDLAHNIKTKYSHFKKWLFENYEIESNKSPIYSLPSYATNYRRLEIYDSKEFARFFYYLIDEVLYDDKEWNDFENALSEIHWDHILENIEPGYDKDGDENSFYTDDNLTSEARRLGDSCLVLSNSFTKWIHEIDDNLISKPIEKVSKLLMKNPKCLSFNYTSTIEKVYGYENVCHIHGRASNYETLIFGHGEEIYDAENELDAVYDNAYTIFESVFKSYKKNINYALKVYGNLFNELFDISSIYIFGHSLSDIDYPYFKRILDSVGENIPVYISTLNEMDFKRKCKILREYGFRGTIEEWK